MDWLSKNWLWVVVTGIRGHCPLYKRLGWSSVPT